MRLREALDNIQCDPDSDLGIEFDTLDATERLLLKFRDEHKTLDIEEYVKEIIRMVGTR